MAHVAEWKRKEVAEIKALFARHTAVAIVGLDKLPATQFQQIRKGLRGRSDLKMARNSLIRLAIEQSKGDIPGLDALEPHIHGNTAVLATDTNPFRLYRQIIAMETQAPAKPGDRVPADVELKKGDTPFKPGPIVGELQKAGIPAAIDSGKVIIRKDHVLIRAGERVDADMAAVLARLEIRPMTVGIDPRAIYEGGTVFTAEILDIDLDTVRGQFATGGARAMQLALHLAYPAPRTIVPLLVMARAKALVLAVNAGVVTEESIAPIMARARAQMLALASRVPDALDDDLRAALTSSHAPSPRAAEASPGRERGPTAGGEVEEVSEEEAAAGLGALFG